MTSPNESNPLSNSKKTYSSFSKKKSVVMTSKVFKLTLDEKDWELLEEFFQKKGLRTATGIKMILRDFIETNFSGS